MQSYAVPEAKNLKPGEKVIVTVAGTELGIFNVAGRFHAVRNTCPDQSGPLCSGDVFDRIDAQITPDRQIQECISERQSVIACPWHGWEYDLRTGECLWNPRFRIRVYAVNVEADGTVSVTV